MIKSKAIATEVCVMHTAYASKSVASVSSLGAPGAAAPAAGAGSAAMAGAIVDLLSCYARELSEAWSTWLSILQQNSRVWPWQEPSMACLMHGSYYLYGSDLKLMKMPSGELEHMQ